ncbi:hypothetical protein [Yersinia enterocolitica]|uniref:Hypothetical phage protein n=1 Tax=Yersinia enterocolitica serotype O:8 / biotype 1B (strain NCTC 13174 / 8081) TaxID=393305 RepID=A1JR17_YERE8|nr:hypothetical protein [Yersinia enterocolitica]AJJ24700.1 hypothetical protein CH49_1751 [Yersinia enterocolitica]EKN4766944.1 hypothetical protein [Yersinia enterocolitica]EKN5956183.1 hypothetical protein [Yersinia enterocolitica]ELI8291975.1 hypothetical protein [Yersinia enterocolitica]ELW7404223.1 hypothetical protein [Yersinia enterocolitica]
MSSTNYVVQLFSEADPQYINSVAELKEVGGSVSLYGENETLLAVYEKNDIQKLAPLSQS